MILGDPALAARMARSERRLSLDELFRQAAARHPDACALIDPPNRATFTDGAPMRLTFAEADRIIGAIAGRLHAMGLPADAVIGIQLPNTVEYILTVLAVLRAGMIAAPLPLLWRRADAVTALTRAGAKALITCRRAGDFDLAQLATYVAADVFSIRYVCAYGSPVPDGAVAFDDLFTLAKPEPVEALARDGEGNAAAHVAVLTFDIGEDGPVPVARNHLELLAGGLSILLEGRLEQDAHILSTLAPSSFGGICLTLLPWLLAGGTLSLHHPFDAATFASQRHDERCAALMLPAAIAFRLAETDFFTREGPTTVLAAWRAPEQLAGSAPWRAHDAILVDVPIFGEAGLLAARRETGGRAASFHAGAVHAAHSAASAVKVAELVLGETGTLAMRGPMVPRYSFPPGVERTDQPHFQIGPGGLVDTGYGCRLDAVTKTLTVTQAPAGLITIGGYRFSLCALMETVGKIDGGATLAALSDTVTGQRFAATAADPQTLAATLAARGANPLVVAAFADAEEDVRQSVLPLRKVAAG
jgi:hypothetical protein